jgi:hypothetical protein
VSALWQAAIAETLQGVARRDVRPSRREVARIFRVAADQIEAGRSVRAFLADASGAGLMALEAELLAEDSMRRTPRFTHAAISALAIERQALARDEPETSND